MKTFCGFTIVLLAYGLLAAAPQASAPSKVNVRPAPPVAPVLTQPQYSPSHLDFGSLWDGQSACRTLSLTPPAAGTITLSIQGGNMFFLAEYREMASANWGWS